MQCALLFLRYSCVLLCWNDRRQISTSSKKQTNKKRNPFLGFDSRMLSLCSIQYGKKIVFYISNYLNWYSTVMVQINCVGGGSCLGPLAVWCIVLLPNWCSVSFWVWWSQTHFGFGNGQPGRVMKILTFLAFLAHCVGFIENLPHGSHFCDILTFSRPQQQAIFSKQVPNHRLQIIDYRVESKGIAEGTGQL